MRMKELPAMERPYEKLELYGSEALTNTELLAIILKSGTKDKTVLQLAQEILQKQGQASTEDLTFMQELSIQEFSQIKGIGKVKAIQLKAICELSKRMAKPIKKEKIILKSSKDVAMLLQQEMQYEKIEMVKVLILNNKNILLKIKNIALGGTNFAMVAPRDVLVDAIKMQAPKIILVHNHPSGDASPSQGDYRTTKRIMEAAELMGISLLDHVVIGQNTYQSIFSADCNEKG